MEKFIRFLKEEEGLVAIEYALIGSLIAVVIIAVVTALGQEIIAIFNTILTALGGTPV